MTFIGTATPGPSGTPGCNARIVPGHVRAPLPGLTTLAMATRRVRWAVAAKLVRRI